MLYYSTKTLLVSILRSLESADKAGGDELIESGKACLFEMHQMSRPLYKAYKTAGPVFDNVSRAIPHVKLMMRAIRRSDKATALKSGRAALAAM